MPSLFFAVVARVCLLEIRPSSRSLVYLSEWADSRAWEEGGLVRYLVAELAAEGATTPRTEAPAMNLALAIDVSGSMAGDKIDAAQRAARAASTSWSVNCAGWSLMHGAPPAPRRCWPN